MLRCFVERDRESRHPVCTRRDRYNSAVGGCNIARTNMNDLPPVDHVQSTPLHGSELWSSHSYRATQSHSSAMTNLSPTTQTFTLNTGAKMPAVGLGTWKSSPDEVRKAVCHALQIGYRHIDTALNYQNEVEVGQGIRDSGVPREEIWVTTKLDNHWHHRVREGFEQSLHDLGIGYIDLYLIHFPCSTDPDDRSKHLPDWDFVKTW